MKSINIQALERECKANDLGRVTELYTLTEIESAVLLFITAVFCEIPYEEIPNLSAGNCPKCSEILQKQWRAAELIHRENPSVTRQMAMATGNSILQKHVQLQRFSRCKQIYTFDKDIAVELIRTKKDIDLPYNFFNRIPYQTMFLDFSACSENVQEQIGMDGCLVQVNKTYLETGVEFYVISTVLFKNGDSTGMRQTVLLNHPTEGIKFVGNDNLKINFNIDKTISESASAEALANETATAQMCLILQSLIYLCSFEPDIHETAVSKIQYRKAKQAKKNKSDLPAREYKVGERFGEDFRKWTKGKLGQASEHTPTGRRNKPHIRRAHWHRHWIGKRNSDERELVVRWHYECLCGLSEDEAEDKLDTVKHQVN